MTTLKICDHHSPMNNDDSPICGDGEFSWWNLKYKQCSNQWQWLNQPPFCHHQDKVNIKWTTRNLLVIDKILNFKSLNLIIYRKSFPKSPVSTKIGTLMMKGIDSSFYLLRQRRVQSLRPSVCPSIPKSCHCNSSETTDPIIMKLGM